MALSNKTIKNLSTVLTPEVITAIYSDERWVDFMMEIVPEIVTEKLKTEDIDLVTQIATCIMDNIVMRPVQTV